jgi:iron complex outermembrane receptor protein
VIDTVGNLLNLRLRGNLGWNRGGYGAALYVNYADDYRNTATGAPVHVASWMTLDLNFSYETPALRAAFLRDMRISLNVQNLLDQDPPFADRGSGDGVFYDGVNANGLGRFVTLQLQKSL